MNIDFSRQLIKGKITEVIFEEMFRVSEEFTIIPIGYEHTIPELAQYQHHVQIKQVLENIRHAPDFVLISQDKRQVFLAEVKYRNLYDNKDILNIAQNLSSKWNPIFLFLASQNEFYFDSCGNIIKNDGNMQYLSESWIKKPVQISYLALLKEFIH